MSRPFTYALAVAFCFLVSGLAHAVIVEVTPATPDDWTWHVTNSTGTIGTGSGTADFVLGPGTPPLGDGSFNLMTPAGGGNQSAQLRYSGAAGIRIDELTSLSYSTYATDWNGSQLPYLTIWLDLDGNGTRDDRLWFEPTYSRAAAGNGNPNPQADPVLNAWQTWDALDGMWYADTAAGPGSNAITLAAYLALPGKANATIINDTAQNIVGIRIASGFASAANNFNAYVDNFTIGTASGVTTFNFELAPIPEVNAAALFGLAAVIAGIGAKICRRSRTGA